MRARDESGFSLIELMVVLSVIALLVALAMAQFKGSSERARNRTAQARLNLSVKAAKAIAVEYDGRFEKDADVPIDPATMSSAEPSSSYVPSTPEPSAVAITVDDDPADPADAPNSRLLVWSVTAGGDWFGMRSTRMGATTYCRGETEADVSDPASCTDTRW